MGSKRRIAKYILPIILKDRYNNQFYVEPFCGGCNAINLVKGNRIASDNNEYLIALYNALKSGWIPEEVYSKDQYTIFKDNFDLVDKHILGYVGFCCSFRGKFFNGYAGSHKCGRNYQNESRKSLLKTFDENIEYIHSEYYNLYIPPNSIIYCDPPYAGTTEYKTGSFNHEKFWGWCTDMANLGHTVFVSEYSAPSSSNIECVWNMDIKDCLSTKNTTIKTEKLFKVNKVL